MGDTLEFNDIYQEVKGAWVSDTTKTLKITDCVGLMPSEPLLYCILCSMH